MAGPPDPTIAIDLADLVAGQEEAGDRLLAKVYQELRAMAGALFRGQRSDHTLQPTALVHEALLRVLPGAGGRAEGQVFESRSHFLAVAAKAMRQILANHARDKGRQKRGGGARRVTLAGIAAPTRSSDLDLVELDAALDDLRGADSDLYRIVEMRMLSGMSWDEIALVAGTSSTTAKRRWRGARSWLQVRLTDEADA